MALREIIARFGFQVDPKGLNKAKSGIAGVVGQARALGAAFAGSLVVGKIKDFVSEITTAGDALGKTATQLGLSGKELQAWQTAAGFAGVEATNLNQGFRILGKNALLAQQGSKQAAEAFDTLGVSIEDASGNLKPANQLAREAGVALGAMEDRTKAVGLAQQVFGRAGAALLPLFKDGEKGLDAALAKLEEFGGGLSDSLIPLAEASRDRFFEFEIATTSLKSQLAVALLPALNQLTLGISKVIAWVSKVTANTTIFKSLITSLGIVLGKVAIAKFGASLLKLGRAALVPLLKFALLFLIVDDLIALFSGKGSVIGTFIDKIFGKGTAKAVVDGIKGIGKAVADVVKTGDFDKLDKDLEEIFGPPGEALVEGIVQIGKDFGEAWDFLVQDVSEGVDSALSTVGSFFSGVGTSIADFVKSIPGKVLALGKAIVDGIAKGIKDGASAVVEALGGVLDAAVKAAMKKFGIGSPSKVAAKLLGQPLPQGVAMGAEDAAPSAARATVGALATASGLSAPRAISAPARGGTRPAIGGGGVVFKSDIAITVNGGSASDPSIQKLRQGVRSELRDNRRATLDALQQLVEVPA
jgi:hypothetical protein